MGGLVSVLKAVLALALVGGTTTAIVAPAFDMAGARNTQRAASAGRAPLANNTPPPSATPEPDRTYPPQVDYEALLRACLESRDPDSEACMNAQSESGLSPEAFRAKIVAKLAPEKAEPAKDRPSLDALLKECLETRDAQSAECVRAGEASGLSAPEWAAKIAAKLDALRQSDFAAYFEKCLATRNFDSEECLRAEQLSGLGTADFEAKFKVKLAAKDGADFSTWFEKCLGTRDLSSAACRKAQELSHLSSADFEAKFKAKLAAKDGGDFWTWFEKCLATRDVHSDPCVRAQALIGMSDADFQAKFARYLAERDAASHKPSPTPKPTPTAKPTPVPAPTVWTAYVELLVKGCLVKYAAATATPGSTEAITAAGEACQKAMTATGLSPHDFWARFGASQPAKN